MNFTIGSVMKTIISIGFVVVLAGSAYLGVELYVATKQPPPCTIPAGDYREELRITWSSCSDLEFEPIRWVHVRPGQLGCGEYRYRTQTRGAGCTYSARWNGARTQGGTWRESGEVLVSCSNKHDCAYLVEAKGKLHPTRR